MSYKSKVELIESNLIDNLNDQQKVVKVDQYISSVVLVLLEDNDVYNTGTYLDSHANMAVCEKHCCVILIQDSRLILLLLVMRWDKC